MSQVKERERQNQIIKKWTYNFLLYPALLLTVYLIQITFYWQFIDISNNITGNIYIKIYKYIKYMQKYIKN